MKNSIHSSIVKYVHGSLRKYAVYCSLMFIAINPLSEGDGEGDSYSSEPSYSHAYTSVYGRGASSRGYDSVDDHYDRVIDYYKLGKLYLLQGELTNSYRAFSLGENVEDFGTLPQSSVVNRYDPLLPPTPGTRHTIIGREKIDQYLNDLILLYLKRVEILAKNPAYAEEALKEIEKIYIIDPHNIRAKQIEKQLRQQLQNAPVRTSQRRPVPTARTARPTPPVQPPAERTQEVAVMGPREEALVSAQNVMSASLLSSPEIEEMDRTIKEYYDLGKKYLHEKDYFNTIVAFKKVLALNPNHLYAGYARQFIQMAIEKIRAREEHDLQLLEQGTLGAREVFGRTPERTLERPLPVATTLPEPTEAKSGDAFMRARRKKILKTQIHNVLASIRKHMNEGRYEVARRNLATLLQVDSENQQAIALVGELELMIHEKQEFERMKSDRERILAEEREREAYQAKMRQRLTMRRSIEHKYKRWRTMSDKAAKRQLYKKTKEKMLTARQALDEHDYYTVQRELELLFLLKPDHAAGEEIAKQMQTEIVELQSLLDPSQVRSAVPDSVSEREGIETPERETRITKVETLPPPKKQSQNNAAAKAVFSSLANYKPISVLTAEQSNTKEAPPADQMMKDQSTQTVSAPTPKETSPPPAEEKTELSEQDTPSAVNSTPLTEPQEKAVTVRKTADTEVPVVGAEKKEDKEAVTPPSQQQPTEEAVPSSDTSQEETSIAERDTHDAKAEDQKQATIPQPNNGNKLREYIERGKRHYHQGNFPLALVAFNKVKRLDKAGIYAKEIDSLIHATKQKLQNYG